MHGFNDDMFESFVRTKFSSDFTSEVIGDSSNVKGSVFASFSFHCSSDFFQERYKNYTSTSSLIAILYSSFFKYYQSKVRRILKET